MKPPATIKDVFSAFGRASYYAQLMEHNVVSIWMLDSVTQGISLTKHDLLRFQKDWGKKTFGQLLKPLQKSNLISDEIKMFLEQVRVARNNLTHGFFLDPAIGIGTFVRWNRVLRISWLVHNIGYGSIISPSF